MLRLKPRGAQDYPCATAAWLPAPAFPLSSKQLAACGAEPSWKRRARMALFGPLVPRAFAGFRCFRSAAAAAECAARFAACASARAALLRRAEESCPVCFSAAPDTVTACGHWFCEACLLPWLSGRRSCPLCREGPSPASWPSAFVVRAADDERGRDEAPDALLDWLASALRARVGRGDRVLLVSSHGECHEALAARLRRSRAEGLLVSVWRGNCGELRRAARDFAAAPSVLIADPAAVPLRWMTPSASRVVALLPLRGYGCCLLRQAVDAAAPGAAFEVVWRAPQATAGEARRDDPADASVRLCERSTCVFRIMPRLWSSSSRE